MAGLTTGGARPSVGSATPSIVPISAAWSSIAARSASVSPAARSYTTTVGMALGSWNGASRSRARVDSADSGSHEEASLFWTSASLAANPADPAITSSHAPDDEPRGDPSGQDARETTVHDIQWSRTPGGPHPRTRSRGSAPARARPSPPR